jgi:hypothetical protein
MLKKIENIASAAEFKNNSRYVGGLQSLPGFSGGKSNLSDSLSFSSAFKYLSQLKWQLKSLVHSENDEIVLEFIVEHFSFQTKVNINDCSSTNINYNIINYNDLSSSEHKYQIIISFDFEPEVYTEPSLSSSIKYLNSLFDKFASYNSVLSKTSNNSEINSFFLDDWYTQLRYELSLIHRNLIYFVEKVTGEVLSKKTGITPNIIGDDKLIKILEINVKS